MEYSNRDAQTQAAAPAQSSAAGASGTGKRNKADKDKMTRIGVVAAVLAVVILLIGVIWVTVASNGNADESKYVDSAKLQAVFLNTGQVYFGNVKTLNS